MFSATCRCKDFNGLRYFGVRRFDAFCWYGGEMGRNWRIAQPKNQIKSMAHSGGTMPNVNHLVYGLRLLGPA
jgi:hypothetical protein